MYTIKIDCKKYVKAYIENNCGRPADLKHLPDLQHELQLCLRNIPRNKREFRIAQWQDEIEVILADDLFYRYGWEINRENVFAFNKAAERKVKFLMRQYVSLNIAIGMSKTAAIHSFQDKFGYNEDIWSFESIKKDFDRNCQSYKIELMKNIRQEILKIFLVNLSEFGTISGKLKKEHCDG